MPPLRGEGASHHAQPRCARRIAAGEGQTRPSSSRQSRSRGSELRRGYPLPVSARSRITQRVEGHVPELNYMGGYRPISLLRPVPTQLASDEYPSNVL